MKQLTVIPNTTDGKRLLEQHTLDIPPCCPVSKNPRPGSKITLCYRPNGKSLEVASLLAYIHSYPGGFYDEHGVLLVRDMEGMIKRIAEDCATLLGVPVRVRANLLILPKQHMILVARGYPSN
jgi:NADPH-dependent 7-cyano-7-deazaguanine reductase QueF